ncbi:MAG: MFS transporter [Candidatus Nanopelagicales bacterium]
MSKARSRAAPPRSLSALRFVVGFGAVSALADIVYEGARSMYGPYLDSLGATAFIVSVIAGGGEALALVARLVFGRLADARTRRWFLAIAGYTLTVIAVPLLGLTSTLWIACVLILLERLGKAVRSPSKDAMLAQAGTVTGRGWAFAIHEAMDQTGAFIGPLLVALAFALSGSFGPGFLVLALPGAAAITVLVALRRRVPDTAIYEPAPTPPRPADGAAQPRLPRPFWLYAAFTALTMSGFTTFGLLSFHLVEVSAISIALVPVFYAVAMAVDAVAALVSGRWYDRVGLGGLIAVPIFAAIIPWLGFSATLVGVVIGMALWGAALGIQESTMRAAVADFVPDSRRGSAYGIFTAIYGLAWLGGSVAIGALYEVSTVWVAVAITGCQFLAIVVFVAFRRSVFRAPATGR